MNSAQKYLYIMLSNTFSLPTRAIGVYTRAPYNHASLALDRDLKAMYSFGRLRPNRPLPGGLVRERQWEGTFGYFKNTLCAIYRMAVTDPQYAAVETVIADFMAEQEQYKFNIIGFFGLAAGRPIERSNAYFCSQFVATVLSRAGIQLFSKAPGLVKPSDFPATGRLELIFEGRLKDYGTPPGEVWDEMSLAADNCSAQDNKTN